MIQPDLGRDEGKPAFLAQAFDWVEFRRITLRRQERYLDDPALLDECQIRSEQSRAQAVELAGVKGSAWRSRR